MNKSMKMINIGEVSADLLKKININNVNDLIKIGAENAFLKLKAIDNTLCLNFLYSLEGAIRNIKWYELEEKRKNELKNFFNSLKTNEKTSN